jgi:broad specificity phosphatase PhoE
MKTLDVRRHSRRDTGSAHLNQAGVDLALRLVPGSPVYSFCWSSPALRAIETAIGLGCAITREEDLLALPEMHGLAIELDSIKNFADAARMSRGGQHVPDYCDALRALTAEAFAALAAGEAALWVSHGGIVECVAAALDHAHAAVLGSGVGFCEGVRLLQDDNGISIEPLRL